MEYGKDPVGAFHKLVLAADSGHFKAAQGVARSYWPKDNNFIKKYGRDEVDAKINILENAIRKNDKIYLMYKLETDLILAGLYNKDLSAAYDPVKARSIYRRLSEDKKVNAWSHYAKMSFDGAGGERDLAQAYFYYSAICKVFDFDSFDAERAWEMRNKIVEIIEPHVALSELDRLNIWLDDDSQRPYPYHTVYTQGNPETENAVKAQKEREEIHVKNLQKMIE